MTERGSVPQLGGRNQSVRVTPFPTPRGNTLQPFLQIRSGHRISIDADVPCEETCKTFQKPPFEIAINVFTRPNDQGKTCDEVFFFTQKTAYEICHMEELG